MRMNVQTIDVIQPAALVRESSILLLASHNTKIRLEGVPLQKLCHGQVKSRIWNEADSCNQ